MLHCIALSCFTLSPLIILPDVSLVKKKTRSTHCSGQFFIQCQGLFRSVLYSMLRVVQVSSLFNVKGCSGQLFIQCQG